MKFISKYGNFENIPGVLSEVIDLMEFKYI